MSRTKNRKRSFDVQVPAPRCPYCHDDVLTEELKHGCPSCMAWHHEDCWVEGGVACSTCGFADEVEDEAELEESSQDDLEEEATFEPEPPGLLARLGASFTTVAIYTAVAAWGITGALTGTLLGAALSAAIFHEPNPLVIIPFAILSFVLAMKFGMRAAGIR